MNPFELLQNTAKLKEEAQKMQDELAALSADGSSGGKMITVTVNGKMEMTAIHIDPVCVDKRDVAMLEDLIVAAHHDAIANIQEQIKAKSGSLLQGLNIPRIEYMNALEELVDSFAHLPGIGKKSASRIVHYLLKSDRAYVNRFAEQLSVLQDRIKQCSVCGSWTEDDPCPICSNPLRDKTLICVVEQPQDVQTIESAHEYTGLYHVLGGVISPIDGIGPDQLRIASLLSRVKDEHIEEIIIATNPTVEGDTTALYVQQLLAKTGGVKVTRLASGIPVGGDLEYTDKLTLMRSFRGRIAL